MSITIHIPASELAKLRQQAIDLEGKLSEVKAKIEAVKVLTGKDIDGFLEHPGTGTIVGTIVELVSKKACSNQDLRVGLEQAGLSSKSLYNHTSTLAKQKKIKKNKDGLWVKG